MIDCTHARMLWLWQRRDAQELDVAAVALLEGHLEQCPACLDWTQQERRADDALGAAVRNVPLPAQLAERIQSRLAQERPHRRLPWVAAAASVMLLASGFGFYFLHDSRVAVGVEDFQTVGGSLIAVEVSPESVEQLFAEEGHAIEVPRDFLYEKLRAPVGFWPFKGRRVPKLEFLHRGNAEFPAAVADLYIVDERQFQVDKLREAIPSPVPGSHNTIQVRQGTGCVYVIVYTGSSLQPFLIAAPNPNATQ